MKISAKVGASTRLYMKKFHKSQRDPKPSRWVNPGLEKGYSARRVDPGWLLRSYKHLLQIDCTRVDPLRRVEANPGCLKGALAETHETVLIPQIFNDVFIQKGISNTLFGSICFKRNNAYHLFY